jgi:CheY-like chemotaxis protein
MMIDDPIVMLVDDSVNDATLLRAVFARAGIVEPLRSSQNVDEAMAYLRGDGHYCDRNQFPLPTALLLDLNMPGQNGFDLLEWIRQQPALKRLRVFILSASSRPQDIERAYDLGASSYLVKPRNLDGLMHLAKSVVGWLKLNHFAPLSASIPDDGFTAARSEHVGMDFAHHQSMR